METRVPQHIFVVENSKLFIGLLDYVFSKSITYRFLDFKSGEDCLSNLHLQPKLVVLDQVLPGMNGLETLLELKEQHSETHVIVLLDADERHLPTHFIKAGAAACIVKDGNEHVIVAEKIESFLRADLEKSSKKPALEFFSRKKFYYALLILILLSIGFYFY